MQTIIIIIIALMVLILITALFTDIFYSGRKTITDCYNINGTCVEAERCPEGTQHSYVGDDFCEDLRDKESICCVNY